MPARWSYQRLSAWAVIGGVELPIVRAQIDFTLNAVPRATVLLPVGRDAASLLASPVHGAIGALDDVVPAQVWMNAGPSLSSDGAGDPAALGIPAGPFLAFDGYTSGAGYVRGSDGAQFYVSMNHWLVLLTESSALSKSSNPANPSFFTIGALSESDDAGALDLTTNSQAHKYLTQEAITKDFWGSALLPWFRAMCQRDTLLALDKGLVGSGKNTAALAALARMTTKVQGYRPLNLDLDVSEDVASEIAEDTAIMTGDPELMPHITLWDCLAAKFAPEYCFAVVPRVRDAVVAPYVPCYRGDGGKPFIAIGADQCDRIGGNKELKRPLRAYGILSSLETATGADMHDDDAPADMGIGGLFDTGKEGMITIASGPRWMARLVAPATVGDAASGGNGKPIGNALHPGAGTSNKARRQAKARGPVIKSLLNKYAQMRYAEDALRGRFLTLGGALRFDVAPGSVVRVEGATDQFLAGDSAGQPFWGTALQVSIVIDSESKIAGTGLHVGYTRNDAENNDPRKAVARHPVYRQTFFGTSLV